MLEWCSAETRGWIRAAVLVALLTTVPAAAHAQPADRSLRIGTFNAWMFPGMGGGVEVPAIYPAGALVPICPFVEANGPYQNPPDPSWWCEVGAHPVYEQNEIVLGALDLAKRIKLSGYDVIALNELWDLEAAETLVEELEGDYPFIVYGLGNPDATAQKTHSGLALFSKLPFSRIPDSFRSGYTSYESGKVIIGNIDDDASLFAAFLEYDAKELDDEHTSKGVAYVRIVNPATGRVHNVFWSHTQSTYLSNIDEYPNYYAGAEYRDAELQQFADMLAKGEPPTATENPIVRSTQDIFLLGDLNVDGDLSNPNSSLNADWTTSTNFDNIGEWTRYFGSGSTWRGGLLSTVLADAWATAHPLADTLLSPTTLDDFGTTSGMCPSTSASAHNCRFDYIVHNTPALGIPERRLCNQHTHIAFNLDSAPPLKKGANPPGGRGSSIGPADGLYGQPSAGYRSDHLGVMANYNMLAEQCSPLSPARALSVYGAHPTAGKSFGIRSLTNSEVGLTAGGHKDYANPPKMMSGALAAPGSVQWWLVSQAGVYLIGFENDGNPTTANTSDEIGYEYTVYTADNLSIPTASYREEKYKGKVKDGEVTKDIAGKKFIFDKPPYYIKIYHPVHNHFGVPFNGSGSYKFAVRRLGCTDKLDDACPLIPNTPLEQVFPAFPINSSPTVDSMYFDLRVEPLTVSSSQRLELVAFDYSNDYLESHVVTETGGDVTRTIGTVLENRGFNDRLAIETITTGSTGFNGTCPNGTGPMGVPSLPRCNNRISVTHPQPAGDAEKRIWRVRRSPNAPVFSTPYQATWTTELTSFYGSLVAADAPAMDLLCDVETSDGPGEHDEIWMSIDVDGVSMLSSSSNYEVFIADFKPEISIAAENRLNLFTSGRPVRFKSKLTLGLLEEDNFDFQGAYLDISPLTRNRFGPSSAQTSVPREWSLDDGIYSIRFGLSHGTQRVAP